MENRIFLVLFLASFALLTLGCHPEKNDGDDLDDDDENRDVWIDSLPFNPFHSRKKRQAGYPPGLGLREFFVLCMQSYADFRRFDVRTIVNFTIGDTTWFAGTDKDFCPSDTVECWKQLLYSYMDRNSEFFIPALVCIRNYGDYKGRKQVKLVRLPLSYFDSFSRRRQKRQSSNLQVDEREAVFQLQQSLPDYRGDFRSLIRFFQDDAICSPAFCNCDGIVLPRGEACGQNWYTKLGAMTRSTSRLRGPLLFALNEIATTAARRQEQQNRRSQQQGLVQTLVASQVLKQIQDARTTDPPSPASVATTTSTPTTTLPIRYNYNIITTIIYINVTA